MLSTRSRGEEAALEEPELSDFVLKTVCTLRQDELDVGKVLQFTYCRRYAASDYGLQAELYYWPLPADLFFEKGLVQREHAHEPLQLDKPLEGIVLSKSDGLVFSKVQNRLLLRPEWMPDVLDVLQYHAEQRETFAGYLSSGHSWSGFLDHYYQPPGPDVQEKQFLEKGDAVASINKVTKDGIENNQPVRYEYWNDEKVSMTLPLGVTGIEAIIKRDELQFKRGNEGLCLWKWQLAALKKVIGLFEEYEWNFSKENV